MVSPTTSKTFLCCPALSAKPRHFCSKDGSFKYICFSASMDILTTSLFLAEELCLSIPYSLCPPTKKTKSWVLCVNWWKKSGDHQLMLVVYPVIYHGFTGFIHLRWFSRRISEPSTVCQARWLFFFRAQKSQTTTVWMVLKPSLIMGFQLPFPQLVFVYRISESSTSYVSEVPQTENSKTVEIPNMKLTLTERPRMAHTKTTSRGAGLRPVSNRSFDSESWTKKQLQLEESRFFRRFLEKLAWSF